YFNSSPTSDLYTLSLHDALPISFERGRPAGLLPRSTSFLEIALAEMVNRCCECDHQIRHCISNHRDARRRSIRKRRELKRPCKRDRKSTRLNSSHDQISYAVFCL